MKITPRYGNEILPVRWKVIKNRYLRSRLVSIPRWLHDGANTVLNPGSFKEFNNLSLMFEQFKVLLSQPINVLVEIISGSDVFP